MKTKPKPTPKRRDFSKVTIESTCAKFIRNMHPRMRPSHRDYPVVARIFTAGFANALALMRESMADLPPDESGAFFRRLCKEAQDWVLHQLATQYPPRAERKPHP